MRDFLDNDSSEKHDHTSTTAADRSLRIFGMLFPRDMFHQQLEKNSRPSPRRRLQYDAADRERYRTRVQGRREPECIVDMLGGIARHASIEQ